MNDMQLDHSFQRTTLISLQYHLYNSELQHCKKSKKPSTFEINHEHIIWTRVRVPRVNLCLSFRFIKLLRPRTQGQGQISYLLNVYYYGKMVLQTSIEHSIMKGHLHVNLTIQTDLLASKTRHA